MTDEKKTVSYVSRERMLFEALGWLRTMEQALKELGENRDKLIEENYVRDWYPSLSGKTWRDVDDNIELCLKELGKCAERKNKENKEN